MAWQWRSGGGFQGIGALGGLWYVRKRPKWLKNYHKNVPGMLWNNAWFLWLSFTSGSMSSWFKDLFTSIDKLFFSIACMEPLHSEKNYELIAHTWNVWLWFSLFLLCGRFSNLSKCNLSKFSISARFRSSQNENTY